MHSKSRKATSIVLFAKMVIGSNSLVAIILLFNFNPSRPGPGRREKINVIFYLTILFGAAKGFYKTF